MGEGPRAASQVQTQDPQESSLQDLLEPISTGGGGVSGHLLGSSHDPPQIRLQTPPGENGWAEHID